MAFGALIFVCAQLTFAGAPDVPGHPDAKKNLTALPYRQGELIVRFADTGPEAPIRRAIPGPLTRRGIKFVDFIQTHYDGRQLPRFRICVEGRDEIYYEMDEYEKRVDELKERTRASTLDEEEESIAAEELHEVARINEINKTLKKQFGLDLKDFLLKPARAVSGEALPTKFLLINGEDRYDVASLGDICPGIRQIGGKGIEIKRFKGLGEMNADQLWDTTMPRRFKVFP